MTASFVRQALMFALLPVLTTRVSPEEYGAVSVAMAVVGIAVILMGLGLETPVFRSWFATRDDLERRSRLLDTARALVVLGSIVVLGVGTTAVLAIDVPSDAWSSGLVALALVGAVAQALVTRYALPVLRAEDRTRAYLRIQLAIALLQALLLVVLVLLLPGRALGWMTAVVVAQWGGVALAAWYLRPPMQLRVNRAASRELFRLSLPLIPHATAHWSLAGVDRLVLLAFVPAATVGVYGLVYSVSALVGMVLSELTHALMNEYGRLVGADQETLQHDLSVLATVQVVASLVIAFSAATLGPPLFRLVFPDDYISGAAVIPWIVLGYLFFGCYYIFVNRLTVVEGRAGFLAAATTLGALVNLAANVLLIPAHGMFGAAVATALGYAVMLVAVGLYVTRTSSLPFTVSWRVLALVGGVLGLLWAGLTAGRLLPGPWPLLLTASASVVAAALGLAVLRSQLQSLWTHD